MRSKARRAAKLPVFLDAEETLAFLNARSARSATGTRDRGMFEMMIYSGLRLGETLNLRPRDVDLDGRVVRIVEGKGKKDRTVPLRTSTIRWLRLWVERRAALGYDDRAWFFCGIRTKGDRLGSRSVQSAVKSRAERAGITKRCSPHVLRHTFATTLLSAGMSIQEVADLLGHSSSATTAIYTHADPRRLIEKFRALDEAQQEGADQAAAFAALSPQQRARLLALARVGGQG